MKTIEERAKEKYRKYDQYDWILEKGYIAGAYEENEILTELLKKKDDEIAQLAQFLKERINRDMIHQKVMEEMGEALERGINRIQSAYVNGTFPHEEYEKEFRATEEEMVKALGVYDNSL